MMPIKKSAGVRTFFCATLLGTLAFAQASAAREPPVPPQDLVSACAPTAAASDLALHVEVQDQFGPYRAGETVMVSAIDGLPLVTLNCEGPWANFRLAPGTYRVMAFIGDQHSNEVTVNVPPGGTQVALKLEPPPMPPAAPELADDGRVTLPVPPPERDENLGSDNLSYRAP
jgi:hypothetical protein